MLSNIPHIGNIQRRNDDINNAPIVYVVENVQILNKNNGQKPPDYHPFAEKSSPYEEWKQTLMLAIETAI
jgi:hypothetical protein